MATHQKIILGILAIIDFICFVVCFSVARKREDNMDGLFFGLAFVLLANCYWIIKIMGA